jgi:hypothetical protein
MTLPLGREDELGEGTGSFVLSSSAPEIIRVEILRLSPALAEACHSAN